MEIATQDRWGAATDKKIQHVKNVHLEPSSKIVRDKNNAEIRLAATMFYDCRNSYPRNIVFVKDTNIIFNGEIYRIEVIEPLYVRGKLHHYELGLVKGG